jgi:transposase
VHSLRELVNAILYVNRTGIAWEYLPHDFPPAKTVYHYYAKWQADGTTEAIHNALRTKVRVHKGRGPGPTAAIIDSQSMKTSGNVPESDHGVGMGKRIKGRKRHVAVDTLGLLLVVIITAASIQDSAAGKIVLDHLSVAHPTVTKSWVDGGYNAGVVAHGAQKGIDVEVVRRDPETKGFKILPRSAACGSRSRGTVQPSVCLNNRKVCSRSNRRKNACHKRSTCDGGALTREDHNHNGFGSPSPGR